MSLYGVSTRGKAYYANDWPLPTLRRIGADKGMSQDIPYALALIRRSRMGAKAASITVTWPI